MAAPGEAYKGGAGDGTSMRALTYDLDLARMAAAKIMGSIAPEGFLSALGPLRLTDVPDAKVLGDRWVVVETKMCGVCGSDVKQVFMDAAADNPLSSMVSFPHVLGHEHVGEVVEVGSDVTRVRKGDRVACSPWLSCVVRGLPECDACKRGQTSVCESFTKGAFAVGMHAGTCRDVSGGFATHVPVHETACFKIPESVPYERAVLADPVAVSLHAILKSPPADGESVLVFGCGGVGVVLVHLLASLFPKARVMAVDPRPHARALAEKLGAVKTFGTTGAALIEEVGGVLEVPVQRPRFGALPWLPGGFANIYDTVGSPRTIEAALRVVKPQGAVVLVGVATPARFEWTPLYFKEVRLIGSSGYGVETIEGKTANAIEHFLDLADAGRIDPDGVLTHRFALASYKDAFLTARSKGGSPAVKVAFDFTS